LRVVTPVLYPKNGLKSRFLTTDTGLSESTNFGRTNALVRSHKSPLRNRLSSRVSDSASENNKSGLFLGAAFLFNPRKANIHAGFKMVAWGGIEPPTQGFSDRRPSRDRALLPRIAPVAEILRCRSNCGFARGK
jgi:hypothetical protein